MLIGLTRPIGDKTLGKDTTLKHTSGEKFQIFPIVVRDEDNSSGGKVLTPELKQVSELAMDKLEGQE